MNSIDPKNNYFFQFATGQAKTTLAKSMVTQFENKNTEMNLESEIFHEKKPPTKQKNSSKKNHHPDDDVNELSLNSEDQFLKIKRLMNII